MLVSLAAVQLEKALPWQSAANLEGQDLGSHLGRSFLEFLCRLQELVPLAGTGGRVTAGCVWWVAGPTPDMLGSDSWLFTGGLEGVVRNLTELFSGFFLVTLPQRNSGFSCKQGGPALLMDQKPTFSCFVHDFSYSHSFWSLRLEFRIKLYILSR